MLGSSSTNVVATWHATLEEKHSCAAGALAGALRHLYGNGKDGFTFDSNVTNTSRTYPELAIYLREATEARIAGGMHFRFSTVAGQKLGGDVAQYAMRKLFGPRRALTAKP